MMELSEAKRNHFEMPAIDIPGLCIPAECDNIKKPYNGEIASRWDAYLLCDICKHFASLITHNLRCIPAYTHQIPTGFFQSFTKSQGQHVYHFQNKNIKNSLGAKWNASHLAVRLCALRHWKRVSMPPTTQSLRHPLTRAFHFAPRIKTARRFTAKNP